jgi:hypothetical protein
VSESEKDEFAELSDTQEGTVRQAREWVQAMVDDARKSELHLQMAALEMMTQGLAILTGKDLETARADIMRMFDDVAGKAHLVLRRIPAQAPPETSPDDGERQETRPKDKARR